MTHGSLFAGIGGFDLGFERAGIKTVWQVEIDPYCRKVLEKHFPEAKRYDDIRTVLADATKCESRKSGAFHGRQDFGTGSPLESAFIISGGFPCQPVSVAGKRKGKDDSRYLWPEMFRVIQALQPAWIVAENVYGLIAHDGGSLLDAVYDDLEGEGYETLPPLVLPACAFGAPHRRDRVWIVARAEKFSRAVRATKKQRPGRLASGGDGPDDDSTGLSELQGECAAPRTSGYEFPDATAWWAVEPDVRGMAARLSEKLDGGLDANQGMGSSGNQEEVFEGCLRKLWDEIATRSAPSGRRSEEQLTREFADALRCLPHERALGDWQESMAKARCYLYSLRQACETLGTMRDAQKPISAAWESLSEEEKDWTHMAACYGVWWAEWPGVPRTISARIPRRVDRLKGLGNAIVPQIAEWLGRIIQQVSEQSECKQIQKERVKR